MDVFTWMKVGALVLVVLLELVFLLVQSRARRYSKGAEIARAVVAVLAFAGVLWVTGARISIVWSVTAAVIGLALGYLSGSTSKYFDSAKGKAIKASMWPAVVTVLGYTLVMAATLFGTNVIVSAFMLVALLGTCMTVGASIAEAMRGGSAVAAAA